MQRVIFITHGNVVIDESVPVPDWGLSVEGKRKHEELNNKVIVKNVTGIYSSNERKAVEGAEILAAYLGLPVTRYEQLHENNRSATGFLAPEEFERVADAFFEYPNQSIRGWERALDAQSRIVSAVKEIISFHGDKGDIAIVAHGGVGTLLLCSICGKKISRASDQPGNGGGNYFIFNANTFELISGWAPIDV